MNKIIAWIDPQATFWETARAIPAGCRGIYVLLHIPTSRVYVGYSFNIAQRIRGHLNDLRYKNRRNGVLADTWEHDGPHAFHVFIVEPVSDWRLFIVRENFWIDRLNSLLPHGFNLRKFHSVVMSAPDDE